MDGSLLNSRTASKWIYLGNETITLSDVVIEDNEIKIYFTASVSTPASAPAITPTVKSWEPSTPEDIFQFSLKSKAPVVANLMIKM